MSRKNGKQVRGVVATCAIHFLLVSLMVTLILIVLSVQVSRQMVRAVPIIEDLLEYKTYLERDQFEQIPLQHFSDADFIVLDGKGEVCFTTDQKKAKKFDWSSFQMLHNYDSDTFFMVSRMKEQGEERILILEQKEEQDGFTTLQYCVLDQYLKVVEGSLFRKEGQLTPDQLEIIEGSDFQKYVIQRQDYQTVQGEKRTLIFFAPSFDERAYQNQVRSAQLLWLIAIPAVLLLILFQTYVLSRTLQKMIQPFNEAILAYTGGQEAHLEERQTPPELKQIVRNFNSMVERVETARREKEQAYWEYQQVLANLSHDLRTPLAVIQGYTGAINDGVVPEERRGDYLQVIHSRAEAMSELTESLMQYTQLERPNFQLHMEKTEFSEYCRAYLADKYRELSLKGFDLSVDIPEEPVYLQIDRRQFKRVFENLIGNALKNNLAGVQISFRAYFAPDIVQLEISDDGIGIETGLRERVFEPFVSGSEARTPGSGTGLGLSIVRKIVELHGGVIRLEEGRPGTTKAAFLITLPRWNEAEDGQESNEEQDKEQ